MIKTLDPNLTPWPILALGLLTATVSAKNIYVDASATGANDGTSWKDAYALLWVATEHVAQEGDEIWIAEGIYKPIGDRTFTFTLKNNVKWYGGFPAGGGDGTFEARDPAIYITTLSGDLLGNDLPSFVNYSDNSAHVVTANATDASSVIDGLTISHGNSNLSPMKHGGGLRAESGAPTVTRVIFELNRADQAYYAAAYVAGGMFTNCQVRNNGVGSGVYSFGTITVEDCVFENNVGYFLFISFAGDGHVLRSTFIGSLEPKDGSIGLGSASPSLTVVDCNFIHIEGTEGSAMYINGGATFVTNSVFRGNGAQFGTIVASDDGDVTMANCCVVSSDGRGLYALGPDSNVTIFNSIFWDNDGDIQGVDKDPFYDGQLVISYSTIDDWDGSLGGEGNDGDDPMFVDPLGLDGIPGTGDEDFHLLPNSPCIDAGDNAGVPTDTLDLDGDGNSSELLWPFDLDGNPRIFDPIRPNGIYPIVDRGPYEALVRTDPCYSDVNLDGTVDPLDAGFILARLGCSYPADGENCKLSDVNADGLVDPLDVGYVLSRFGRCP